MAGREKPSGVVQGTLDMLILKTLDLEPLHGYGIGLRLHQISRGVLDVNAGSLFPAFRRLEELPPLTEELQAKSPGLRCAPSPRDARCTVLPALLSRAARGGDA